MNTQEMNAAVAEIEKNVEFLTNANVPAETIEEFRADAMLRLSLVGVIANLTRKAAEGIVFSTEEASRVANMANDCAAFMNDSIKSASTSGKHMIAFATEFGKIQWVLDPNDSED